MSTKDTHRVFLSHKTDVGMRLLEAKRVADYLKEVHGIEPAGDRAVLMPAVVITSALNVRNSVFGPTVTFQIDPVAKISKCMLAPSHQLLGCIQTIIDRLTTDGVAEKTEPWTGVSSLSSATGEEDVLNWIQSPQIILQKLEDPATTAEDRITGVLFAETTDFAPNEIPRLLVILEQFIERHRFATDDELTTAVGSAVRKYAMNMSDHHFDRYGQWLLPSQTDTPGHSVELELTKALGWRLCLEPFSREAVTPALLTTLADLCSVYLNRRLILQENFASTTLDGIVAVAILEAVVCESARTEKLCDAAEALQMNWFSDLLADQLADSIEQINVHSPEVADRIQQHAQLQPMKA